MYLTHIRWGRVAAFFVAGSAAMACGQVTGLSDDYQFDLAEGGKPPADAGSDVPRSDAEPAPNDAARDVVTDAANKCSALETMSATLRLEQLNGTMQCKTCLAASCCNDVNACATPGTDCNHTLDCKLACTERPAGNERSKCFLQCNMGGVPVPASYTNGVGACGAGPCRTECGFQ